MTNKIQALKKRLLTLPSKERKILGGLLDLGHIDDNIVNTVLDAGELAGDYSRISAFTISYLSMRSRGTPIADVVHMAKEHRRRINLWWSDKRWADEHNKLSRLTTLKRLAGEPVEYDTRGFQEHLPANFAGYLIRNSRRLGMEGLRQRHCVAYWHDRLRNGHEAICVVFVNKQRWTVQLWKTEADDEPLRILQMKSRFNKAASNEEEDSIRRILDIEKPARLAADMPFRSGAEWRHTMTQILQTLQTHQVECVTVGFDGSGDSGCVEEPQIRGGDLPAELTIEVAKTLSRFEAGHWIQQVTVIPMSLTDAIVFVCEEYLESTGVDWYNSDGGFGELVIDVQKESVEMAVNTRYTHSELEFAEEASFADYLALAKVE